MFEDSGLPPQHAVQIEEAFVRQSLLRNGDAEFQALLAEHLMDRLEPVPNVLAEITRKVLTNTAPEITIRLMPDDVIGTLVSTVRGFFAEPALLEGVRSTGLERRPAVDIGRAGSPVRYQIIRESEKEVLLAVQIDAPGALRASLRREGRIVASRTMSSGEASLAFEHLGAGSYTLELSGSRAESVSFQIDGE